jgi:hypothetical protein
MLSHEILCMYYLHFFVSVSKIPSLELSQNAYVESNASVPHSVESHSTNRLPNFQKGFTNRWKIAYYYLWKDFTTAYTNIYVIKWSFWWALATCGFLQARALRFRNIFKKHVTLCTYKLVWYHHLSQLNSVGVFTLYLL